MRKASTAFLHGISDYAISGLLLAAPWVLGFAGDRNSTIFSVAAGAATIVYSLFTDYEVGVFRRMTLARHFECDVVIGLLLIVLPMALDLHTRGPLMVLGLVQLIQTLAMALMVGIVRIPSRGKPAH